MFSSMVISLYPPGRFSIVALLSMSRCHVVFGVGIANARQVNSAVPPGVTMIRPLGASTNSGMPTTICEFNICTSHFSPRL